MPNKFNKIKRKQPHLIFPLVLSIFFSLCKTGVAEDLFFQSINDYKKVMVDKIIRADLIVLDNGERIRLIGIKAPEAPKIVTKKEDYDKFGFLIKEEDPFVTIEEKTFDFVKTLLEGRYVRIEFDDEKKDDNFDNYGYVFLVEDNLFVNAEILRMGFASLQIRPPNLKYADTLRKAYKEARKEMRGIHNE